MKAPFLFLPAAKPTTPTRPGKPAGGCFPKKKNIIFILTSFLNVSPVVEFLVFSLLFVCLFVLLLPLVPLVS